MRVTYEPTPIPVCRPTKCAAMCEIRSRTVDECTDRHRHVVCEKQNCLNIPAPLRTFCFASRENHELFIVLLVIRQVSGPSALENLLRLLPEMLTRT